MFVWCVNDRQTGRATRGNVRSRHRKALKPRDHQVTCSSIGTEAKICVPDLWLLHFHYRQRSGMHREREKGFLCGQYVTDGVWFSWAITSAAVGVESRRHQKGGEAVKGWRGKEEKEGSMEISFHLFNHLSATWHCWDAILQLLCDEWVYVHVFVEIKQTYAFIAW